MNDFGGQEPGSNKEIAEFCVNQYAIDFPMFAKTELKNNPLSPTWRERPASAEVELPQVPRRPQRQAVQSFDTRVAPEDPKLVAAIEKLLEDK